MASSDIDKLGSPILGEDPCGPNLEYDAAFSALERTAAGKPEQQIGATIVKAEDPDWVAVELEARALLLRTKDLRVALHLTKALLRTRAWDGFADGLELLAVFLEQSWEGVHPRLDPDEDNDPTTRLNILAGLADQPTVTAVRATPLLSSRAAGHVSLRDVEVAAGEGHPAGEGGEAGAAAGPSASMIEGIAGEIALPELEAKAAAVARCQAALKRVDTFLAEKAGGSAEFGRLAVVVASAASFLNGHVAQRNPEAAGDGAGDAGGASRRPLGEISSREDVVRALDKIVAYYSRYEPSSPIPILIERSKKLVKMSFFDIIRELVPGGVAEVEVLRGRTE